MTNHSPTDRHVDELLSGFIDGELTQQDRQRVRVHCESCAQCAAQLQELEAMRAGIGRARISDVSQDQWREHMNDSTVKTTRGIGWLLFIGGLLIAAGIAIFEFVLLFISVLRQRLIERKTDKYKDVEI